MPKPESDQENETYRILWHFEIHTDNLIHAKKSDLLLIIKTKICRSIYLK